MYTEPYINIANLFLYNFRFKRRANLLIMTIILYAVNCKLYLKGEQPIACIPLKFCYVSFSK